jgi:hypothetical protein
MNKVDSDIGKKTLHGLSNMESKKEEINNILSFSFSEMKQVPFIVGDGKNGSQKIGCSLKLIDSLKIVRIINEFMYPPKAEDEDLYE